ncbi:hypothetical protein KR032_010275, partial [Drosophila birchii]
QQFLRLLVLFGLLLACQARTLDQEKIPEQEKVANQEIGSPPEVLKPVEVKKEEVSKGNQEPEPQISNSINNQVSQEAQPSQSNSIQPVAAQVKPEVKNEEKETIANEIAKEQEEELPKEESPKPNVVPLKPSEVQGRDKGNVQYVYDSNGQLLGIQDLEKIFKYQGVQVINGTQISGQYPNQHGNLFNKFQSFPKVEYVPETVTVVNTTGANVTHHIHNHTHYYSNQKKPGFSLPFLPNPFEKNEPSYVQVNLNSTSGNVTQHVYEESKPFPFLPNPFTDFPKVVGLSLVLLPNPFYVNKSQSSVGSSSGNVQYQYYEKFRAFSDEPQQQQQQQQQKPNFYLVPNPLVNQVSTDGQKAGDANVLLPVNLAALPLLVPTSEVSQGKTSTVSAGSIKFEDLIKATNVHVSQPLKLQASNGASQFQKDQAAVQQLILSHLSQQQKLFQKQSLVPDERRSASAADPAGVQAEEESSVLFAVEIPKPIYRFFKGIFGGFSN